MTHPDYESTAVRKVLSFTHSTLDGYIDDPHLWSLAYSDDELRPTCSR